MDLRDLNELRSVDELSEYRDTVRGRIAELNTQYAGLPFPDDARDEFATLRDTEKETGDRITELRAREQYVQALSADQRKIERTTEDIFRSQPRSAREDDIFDLSTIRSDPFGDNSHGHREIKDRALKAIDRNANLRPESQDYIARMLEGGEGDLAAHVGKRVLLTGHPAYKRAWGKAVLGVQLDSREMDALNRAASLTTTAGGFAVPYDLDTSLILTSNGVVNPMRQISRVVQTNVDTWQGVSSAGLATSYGYTTEAAEAADNAATIAQPQISTERAQAFVPFSIEIGQDWASFTSEMAVLFQDAKDTVEGTAFVTGTGTNAPQGVLTGGTAFVQTAGTAAFVVADLYSLEEALPPRYRPRAQFIGNRFIYNKVRQLDTSGGASLWIYLAAGLSNVPTGNTGAQLIGYPANEASNMSAALTAGLTILCIGDFSRYVIVDRVGMSVELLPHLLGANRRPTGQRGLYAFWRNGAGVVDANAFRRLVTLA